MGLVRVKRPVDLLTVFVGVAAALFYGTCSGSMAFVNKLVLSTYEFNMPFIIMLCQMILATAVLKVLSLIGKVSLPEVTYGNVKICRLPAIFGLFHSVLSLHALSGMNVTMYTVLKRCVPLMSLLLTPLLGQKGTLNLSIKGSVVLITVGCIFTGLGDLTFNLHAYTFGILSIFSQGLYLTFVQKTGMQNETFSVAGIMYLNGLNCLPLLLLAAVTFGEFTHLAAFPNLLSPSFLAVYLLVISLGCLLNYSLFLCTMLTSALTTSVVGVVKSVVVVVVGLFTFGGVQLTTVSAAGIVMNTFGSCWFALAKLKAKNASAGAVDAEEGRGDDVTDLPQVVIERNGVGNHRADTS